VKVKTLSGKEINLKLPNRRINWDKKCRSNFQFDVKQFFKPYWLVHSVYEEFRIPSLRLYIDLINFSKKIVIESNGEQHQEYNKHFHKGNPLNYLDQIARDRKKSDWCEINGFTFIEIYKDDIPYLSRQFFLEKFNVEIL
jgi:hypothetical protein